MATQAVLDVGNCAPDHASIRQLIESNFDAHVLQAHGPDDTIKTLRERSVSLVLVNRKLDQDYSDGLEIIKQVKADPELAGVPMMLITNYQEHQSLAVAAGAEQGFGKLELAKDATLEKLNGFLDRR